MGYIYTNIGEHLNVTVTGDLVKIIRPGYDGLLWRNLHHFGDAYWRTLMEGMAFSGTFTVQGDVICAAVSNSEILNDDTIIHGQVKHLK